MTTAPKSPGDRGGLAADVQRFGLISAATVVSRYAAIVDRAVATGAPAAAERPRSAEAGSDWLVDGLPRVAEEALRLLDLATRLAERVSTAQPPGSPERAGLPPVAPGMSTQVSVWLHNPTTAVAVVQLHATTLASGSGAVLPPEAVTCDPADGVQVDPGGSREVRLHVVVPSGQPCGRYHGLVVGSLAPDPLLLFVEVTSSPEEGS